MSRGYQQYFSRYEFYSSLNFFYKQTESDASELAVQIAQVD